MSGRNQAMPYFHSGYPQQQAVMNYNYYPYVGRTPVYLQNQNSYQQMQTPPMWQYPQQPGSYMHQQYAYPYQNQPNNYHPSYVHNNPKTMKQNQASQFLFQNPLQPDDDLLHPHYQQAIQPIPNANPYPQQNTGNKQVSSGKSILNSFKGQDGSVDLNKMMDTAGQMMNAVNQVSSLVKGLGGMFKA